MCVKVPSSAPHFHAIKKMQKTQKILVLALLFAAILCAAVLSAEENWPDVSQIAKINVSVGTILEIKREGGSQISYVNANLSFFPKTDEFQRAKTTTVPDSSQSECCISFNWETPEGNSLEYTVNSEVISKRRENPVRARTPFPIQNLEGYDEYLKSSGKITFNYDISNTASEITSGSDNLFEAVSRLSSWVNRNVKYDLKYGNEAKNSTWTFENRKGTCDEFSVLFIAMCRSIGIPARYVSGIAYSNMPEINGFGSHAWAEAYFPGTGWVSFDPTYNQHGYTDSSHIKFMDSPDAEEIPASYSWKSVNAELSPGKIDVNAELVETIRREEEITLNAMLYRKTVALSSYNVIEAEAYNPSDHYITREVSISRSDAFSVIGNDKKYITLAPGEKTRIYWVVKIFGLETGSIYSIPLSIYSGTASSDAVIKAEEYAESVSYEEALLEAQRIDSEKRELYSAQLKTNCTSSAVYSGEKSKISCTIQNIGNAQIKNANICLLSECAAANFSIMQSRTLEFPVYPKTPGNFTLFLTIKNSNISISKKVAYSAIEKPKISIELPEKYIISEKGKNPAINFSIMRIAGSPGDFQIQILPTGHSENLSLSSAINFPLRVSAEINRKSLAPGNNNLTIEAQFSDPTGNKYSERTSVQIYSKKGILELAEFYLTELGALIQSFFLKNFA
jgi:transglutaminase-like putative cysteine protease